MCVRMGGGWGEGRGDKMHHKLSQIAFASLVIDEMYDGNSSCRCPEQKPAVQLQVVRSLHAGRAK